MKTSCSRLLFVLPVLFFAAAMMGRRRRHQAAGLPRPTGCSAADGSRGPAGAQRSVAARRRQQERRPAALEARQQQRISQWPPGAVVATTD